MELYTIKEVAKLLKTNPNMVYALIDAGLIRPLKLGRLKVSEAELVSFINRNAGMDITDPFNPKVLDIATGVEGTEVSV